MVHRDAPPHYPSPVAERSEPARIPAEPTAEPGRTAGAGVASRGRGSAQWAMPARASVTIRIAMALFALGVLAIVVIMVLFASGSRDLPLWLNLTAMLTPIGFGLGLVGVAAEATRSSRALARRAARADGDDDAPG